MSKQARLGDIVFTNKEMKDALLANADGGVENYVGLNDDMVNFGSAESFIDESDAAKEFTMRITNGTAATQKIQLNEIIENVAGYNLLQEGNVVTVGEGASATHVTAEGDPRSIDTLLAYIKKCPMRVRAIKFNVSSEQQLDEPLKYQCETPFMTGTTVQKVPSTFQDQNTNNTKTVEVELKDWILSHSSTILYSIRAGVSVNLTFFFGAALDSSEALKKKHRRAISTAAKFYARQNG